MLTMMFLMISCKKDKEISLNQNEQKNKPPIAYAGNDITIKLPQDSAYLDGGTSFDPDGMIVSFLWSYVHGPASFFIENPTAALTKVKSLIPGEYQFQLAVRDNDGKSSVAVKKIFVNDSIQPLTFKIDTTFAYTDRTVITDTSWLAPFLTEWGSYRTFNLPAIAGVGASSIKVLRRIGAPINSPWSQLSYVSVVYPNMAVPLYGGVYTISGETISTGIGIIGSPTVTIYVQVIVP